MRSGFRHLLVFLIVLHTALPAAADEIGEGEQVFAIQNRIFDRHHEIGLVGGFIPDEDFHHAFPLGINYVFNLNENFAWEVLRGQYVFNLEKDLKTDLEDQFGVTPSEFDRIRYMIHSNLVVKPSYGKDALWNKAIVNHETYGLAGAGVVNYETEFSDGATETEFAFSVMVGVGRKYFINKQFCINLELRDLINFKQEGVENNVYLGVGLGYRFNLAPRRPLEEEGVERLKTYIREKNDDE